MYYVVRATTQGEETETRVWLVQATDKKHAKAIVRRIRAPYYIQDPRVLTVRYAMVIDGEPLLIHIEKTS